MQKTKIKIGNLYKTRVQRLIGMNDFVEKYVRYMFVTDITEIRERIFVSYYTLGGHGGTAYDNIEVCEKEWEDANGETNRSRKNISIKGN